MMRDEFVELFARRPRPRILYLGDNSGTINVSGDSSLVYARDRETNGNVERVKKGNVAANTPAGVPFLVMDTPYQSGFPQIGGVAAEQIDSYAGANYLGAFVGAAQQIGYGDTVGNLTGSNNLLWTGTQIQAKSDTSASLALTVYHASNNPFLIGQRARGTEASPTAVQSGDILFRNSALGRYDASNWAAATRGRLDITATENYSATTQGTAVELWGTPNGSTTTTKTARAKGDGFESIIGGMNNRVLATGTTLTISDDYSLVVADYFTLEGSAAIVLEGDAELRII